MLNNPFIPKQGSNIAIVAGNADIHIINKLENKNIKVIKTIKCEEVYESIAYHPDIVIHPINYDTLIIAPNVFSYYKDKLEGFNLNLIKGEKKLICKYPGDIAYNVGRVYKYAIHDFRYTDELLKFYLRKEGLDFIDVKQGYSKCSISVIDQKSIITSDKVIYSKLKNLGFDVLSIEPGFIELKGQNYGFIGGTSGNITKDLIAFSGDLKNHPQKEKIEEFILSKNKKIEYLSKKGITDIGTIISLYCN